MDRRRDPIIRTRGSTPQPGHPGQPQGAWPGGQQALPPAGRPSDGGAQVDVVAKLEKLNELRIAGLLTDEEFSRQKSRILEML
jgi:hypothetical protein